VNRNIRQIVQSSWMLQMAAMWVAGAVLLMLWPDLWKNLMRTTGYEAHGHCYLWQPKLVSLHVVSDLSIGFSYVIISLALGTLVYRARQDIPFRWLFLAFGIFIIACGSTHFMEVITTYNPLYWLSGYIKLITAVASVVTAMALPPMLQPILRLLNDAKMSAQRKVQLEEANRVLETEIIERKRAQEALLQLQERFHGIYESSKDAIGFAGLDGKVLDVNSAFSRLTQYSKDEILSSDYRNLTPPEYRDVEAEIINRVLETGQPIEHTKEYLRKDGSRVPIEVTTFVVRNSQGATIGLAGLIRDITERRQAAQKSARQTEELNRSNRELEQFASVASHDLQEPLRKIQMFGGRLQQKCGANLSEDCQLCLEKMQDAATRMETLIQDLLSLSRITTKTRPFTNVRLNTVVAGVLSDLEARITNSGAQVEVAELPEVQADTLQMRQLFQNLIGNGLKFQRPNVPPFVKIASLTDSQNNQCTITIEDNGIGFESQYAELIFQPFQRLHGRSTYEGTGIGLSICRKIVERHGGTIRVESTPGQGTTFFITLPLTQATVEQT